MSMAENINIHLYRPDDHMHFFSESLKGVHYHIHNKNENVTLYHGDILEFDIDIDQDGNIAVLILDGEGRLSYNYYDGTIWTDYLLYQVDLTVEEIKHISIKFSLNNPQILFCWHNLSSPSAWSILSFYRENNNWKKDVITRVHYKEDIKPYVLIKDKDHTLYTIYLANNNIIYDLMIARLPAHTYNWVHHSFLCNCIYLKYFHLDALVNEDGVHVSWIDKNKKNYCIKYIHVDDKKDKSYTPELILEIDSPFIRHQLLCQENFIACYGMTEQHIYYTIKPQHNTISPSNWYNSQAISLHPHAIYLIKVIQSMDQPKISYHSNYILSESISDVLPIALHEMDKKIENSKWELVNKNNEASQNHGAFSSLKTNIGKPNEILYESNSDNPLETLKKLNLELYKKDQELNMKNNLLKSLQHEIAFLKEEIIRLNKQNKNYMNILHKNSNNKQNYDEKIMDLQKNCEKLLLDLQLSQQENTILQSNIENYQKELGKMESSLKDVNTENELLTQEMNAIKNMSLFRKLFQ